MPAVDDGLRSKQQLLSDKAKLERELLDAINKEKANGTYGKNNEEIAAMILGEVLDAFNESFSRLAREVLDRIQPAIEKVLINQTAKERAEASARWALAEKQLEQRDKERRDRWNREAEEL
jgi:hypothetical protein